MNQDNIKQSKTEQMTDCTESNKPILQGFLLFRAQGKKDRFAFDA